jgi:hypothetical protein
MNADGRRYERGSAPSVVDRNRFQRRLAYQISDSDYHLHQTTCCHTFFIEDKEIMTAYFDSADLSRTVLLEQGVTCPKCGETIWDYSEVVEIDGVPLDWKWACATS